MGDDNLVLEMRGITKEFPGVKALDQVDFTLRKGEIHALVGENGAGKSTLIKIISGVYHKDAGEIRFEGKSVDISDPRASHALGMSFIYQDRNLVPFFSVAQNMFLGMEPTSQGGLLVDERAMNASASRILSELNVDFDSTAIVEHLSVGQQQLVEIAKALLRSTKVVVLDEPTAPLDSADITVLFRIIRELSDKGVSIIYISHRLHEIFEICDRVTVLRNGQVVGTKNIKSLSSNEIVQMMVGREIKERYPKRNVPIGDAVLSVRDLQKEGVLQNVSFDVRSGEILGITGLVGAGKTELARILFGVDKAAGGSITLKGKEMHKGSITEAMKAGIAFTPQDRRRDGLVLTRSVKENISLASITNYIRFGFISHRQELRNVKQLIERLRIRTPKTSTRVGYLSGGNQQKVVLGKWMSTEYKIYIFDEPTTGIDVGSKVEFYNLMSDLVEAGAGVILISAELPEILGMADRVLVMRGGTAVAEFSADQVTPDQVLNVALKGA